MKSGKLYSEEAKRSSLIMLETMVVKEVSEKTGIDVRTLKRWK